MSSRFASHPRFFGLETHTGLEVGGSQRPTEISRARMGLGPSWGCDASRRRTAMRNLRKPAECPVSRLWVLRFPVHVLPGANFHETRCSTSRDGGDPSERDVRNDTQRWCRDRGNRPHHGLPLTKATLMAKTGHLRAPEARSGGRIRSPGPSDGMSEAIMALHGAFPSCRRGSGRARIDF